VAVRLWLVMLAAWGGGGWRPGEATTLARQAIAALSKIADQ
jgi:hypothetical protein